MLKASKLGKLVVKLVKDPPSPGEPVSSFPSSPPLVRPGQNASGYTIALVEPKMRSSPSFIHMCYSPFAWRVKSVIEIDISNVRFVFFFGIAFPKCSHQGHGSKYRTKVAPTHKLGKLGHCP